MSINPPIKQHHSSKIAFKLSSNASNVIPQKFYVTPKLTALLNETNIAGSNQTYVAEGTGGGFLAASS